MDELLDRFYEGIEHAVKVQFKGYYVKVSQLNSSFFVLVKRCRGKILGEKKKILFDRLKWKPEEIHDRYAKLSKVFEIEYFPYFKLVKSHSNYHFHFLVVKKRLHKIWKITTMTAEEFT